MISGTQTWYDLQTDLFCVTCGTQLVESGLGCPRCHTPIQVSKSVSQVGNDTKLISVLGASGAGKTVYLGMLLDMLDKGFHGMRGLPNGAFSLAVQEQTIGALENRRFPEKTPSEPDKWNWVHCEAFSERKPKRRVEIVTPDVAGEVVALELEQTGASSTIRSLVLNSRGMIVLMDSSRIRDDARCEDMFGVKLATYVASLHTRQQNERRKKVRVPMAFVLTKSDVCSEAEQDANKFAAANLPGLTQLCQQRFQSFAFFSASVVGASMEAFDSFGGRFQVPLHVQPRGIVEPLDWIIACLEKKWRRSK